MNITVTVIYDGTTPAAGTTPYYKGREVRPGDVIRKNDGKIRAVSSVRDGKVYVWGTGGTGREYAVGDPADWNITFTPPATGGWAHLTGYDDDDTEREIIDETSVCPDCAALPGALDYLIAFCEDEEEWRAVRAEPGPASTYDNCHRCGTSYQ